MLGKSPAWQDADGACSGYLVEGGGQVVLLDCGPGVFAKLRRFAIQNLASQRSASTGEALASIYATEQDPQVKRAIIDALGAQKNVKAMVQIARSEKDSRMQQQILERLVSMKSPEANDYLMEIIKK